MKSFVALSILLLSAVAASASITINLNAGRLTQSDGTTSIPVGSLLQIVVSTQDSVFTDPTPGSFTGGSSDDFVLASFSSNDIPGGAGSGSSSNPFTFNLSDFPNLTVGDPIMLRWWPTLTTASPSPSAGTTFGQFRTNAVENGSDIGWNVPADGTYLLQFVTATFGGSEPDSAGRAQFTVVAAVPEPSSFATAIFGGVAMLALRRRLKK